MRVRRKPNAARVTLVATLPSLPEIRRIAAPAPQPNALAHDGRVLYVGSWATGDVHAVDPDCGTVLAQYGSPGLPVGATLRGDELRFVLSEGSGDNRFIRRFLPASGFADDEGYACPGDTGSHLAYDGTDLWLSQRFNRRVVALDDAHAISRVVPVGEQMLGITFARARMYFALWLGRERGGSVLGSLESNAATSRLKIIARFPFIAVGLASDGERLWTNDNRANAVVAFAFPEEPR